jgi:hypothetical protein
MTQEQNNRRSMDMRAEQLAVEDITQEGHSNDVHGNGTIGVTTHGRGTMGTTETGVG